MTRLPSTKALRAFEAAARLGSLKAAADYLSITPSALSRRIQALEDDLGQTLFLRDFKGVMLTEAGRVYAERLSEIFSDLSDATNAVRASVTQHIRVMSPGLFGMLVMSRLKDFERLHPDIKVSLNIFSKESGVDYSKSDSDVVIFYGDGKWEGWEAVSLAPFGNYCMPMCAPDYLRDGPPHDAQSLAQYTWIQVSGHPELWELWCAAAGFPGLRPRNYLEVNSGIMAHTAALNGMGIWLSGGMRPQAPHRHITRNLVLAHPLHAFFDTPCYHLHYRPQSPNWPLVAKFRDWALQALAPGNPASTSTKQSPAIS